jgi:hypothetical protein
MVQEGAVVVEVRVVMGVQVVVVVELLVHLPVEVDWVAVAVAALAVELVS